MIKKLTVVHSNELIEASYSLKIDEMRLLNLALTKIDSRGPNPGTIDLYPQEFEDMFSIKNNVWRCMSNAIDSIMKNPVSIIKPDSEGVLKKTNLAWLVESTYGVYEDQGAKLSIEFSPKITPYLFELKEKFTSINFEYASRLTTPFSYRLYSWLMEAKNLKNAKKGETICVELEIEWMKIRAGLTGNYEIWGKFKDKVIQPAIDHINTKTDISVSWSPILKGRSTHSIEFTYSLQKAKETKPLRPRLFRRPKVVAGSHAEGEWMRKNLRLLIAYEIELQNFDPLAKIEMADLKKMSAYSKKLGDILSHEQYEKQIIDRKKPKLVKKIEDVPQAEPIKEDPIEIAKPLAKNKPVDVTRTSLFKDVRKKLLAKNLESSNVNPGRNSKVEKQEKVTSEPKVKKKLTVEEALDDTSWADDFENVI